jgi:hypothetical protein
MSGIGEVLEKLIDVLQLEGHELFRIFTEVQPAIAICNAIVVLCVFIGAILGIVLLHKIAKKKNWFGDWDEDDIVIIYICTAAASGLILLILGVVVTHVYLYVNYPEYYAAKELISSLVP